MFAAIPAPSAALDVACAEAAALRLRDEVGARFVEALVIVVAEDRQHVCGVPRGGNLVAERSGDVRHAELEPAVVDAREVEGAAADPPQPLVGEAEVEPGPAHGAAGRVVAAAPFTDVGQCGHVFELVAQLPVDAAVILDVEADEPLAVRVEAGHDVALDLPGVQRGSAGCISRSPTSGSG